MEAQVQRILDQIQRLSIRTFGNNLVGVYVHGSLALGCFHWDNSDIDFIVVVKDTLTATQKEAYISGLLAVNEQCPPKGLEMSVVLERYAWNFVYPTPFELHFSKDHLKECAANIGDYCRRMNGTDKDLAAHFTVIRKSCIVVYGRPAEETFGDVPKGDYLDSIQDDIARAEEDIIHNPVYIILNLCRVLAAAAV